jgi:hypothetical protein
MLATLAASNPMFPDFVTQKLSQEERQISMFERETVCNEVCGAFCKK